ncbi:hypothetical protein L0F67_11620 [Actinobacillus suis]|uniref:hypothetical protein n=1 Tax=Actinobacillus suis TaxID=716 RepID=UPI00207C5DA0|nr:hypothetical protein [Actinobacillus suis]MCO4166514.1 hypothetical protein [Actinobacillus suis]UTH25400.1 hypothetical protein L0F67_11620 [Actinobacillus suis]
MFSISKFYLFPQGYIFKILSFVESYFKVILVGLFISIVSYPSYRYFYEQYRQKELLSVQQQLTEVINQKNYSIRALPSIMMTLKEKNSLLVALISNYNIYLSFIK